ncbi:MAG: hypothetical protein OEZ13_09410 [Spirochaetia bacterium]|nr:hypothetical protein [Spirochaetia bacterium]
MKFLKKTIYLVSIVLFSSTLFAQEAKKRIAVMPFENGEGVTKGEAKYLTERVRTELIKTGLFEVISNDQIETMMKTQEKKQGIGPGSCNTEQCIIDLGNALECEKMLVGSAQGAFKEFVINGKILDVVSQQYEGAEDETINNKDEFPEAARRMITKLTTRYKGANDIEIGSDGANYTGMLWRSFVLPGWGHIYAGQKRGYIYSGIWALTTGALLWSHFDFKSKKQKYSDATENHDALYDSANSMYKTRGYFFTAFAAFTAGIIADMAITGKDYVSNYTSAFDIKIAQFFEKGNFKATGVQIDFIKKL